MKHRRYAFIVIALSILLCCACSKDISQEVKESDIVIDFLKSRNVNDSRILKADYSFFGDTDRIHCSGTYWDTYDRVAETLPLFFDFKAIEKSQVENGDIIKAKLIVNTDNHPELTYIKECVIVVGAGLFNTGVEKALIGAKEGSVCHAVMTEDGAGEDLLPSSSITVEVQSFLVCHAEDDVIDSLQLNGLTDFSDFYRYLFDVKKSEQAFVQYDKLKSDFYNEAFLNCKFDISDDDLKNYTIRVAEEYEQIAQDLSLTIEDFYTSILNVEENAFFTTCFDSAEYDIKCALIVGLVAWKYNLTVENSDLEAYCLRRNITIADDIDRIEALYVCLEEKVLARYGILKAKVGQE